MSRIWKISHLSNTGVSAGPGTPLPTGRSTAGPCLIYVAGKAALYREHCSSRPQPSNERWAATLGESLGEAISPEKIIFSKFDFHQTFWIDVTSAVTTCLARFPFHWYWSWLDFQNRKLSLYSLKASRSTEEAIPVKFLISVYSNHNIDCSVVIDIDIDETAFKILSSSSHLEDAHLVLGSGSRPRSVGAGGQAKWCAARHFISSRLNLKLSGSGRDRITHGLKIEMTWHDWSSWTNGSLNIQ